MPILGMSSIWYPVAEWERAKTFYTDLLGLSLQACDNAAGWASLAVGSPSIPFFLVRNARKAGSGGPVLGFDVTDAATLLSRLTTAGIRVDAHVQEGAGVRIYTVYDPDGNAIELSETIQHQD